MTTLADKMDVQQQPRILIDDREKSNIPKLLEKLGADIVIQRLDFGDYVVSDETAFEYKSGEDFLTSEVGDEKLKVNRQTLDLVNNYRKPALLIGCSIEDVLHLRRIHKNAVMAFIQSITWIGCPVRFLNTPEIAANYIYNVAKHEQIGGKRDFCAHGSKTKRLLSESLEYIVSSIPDVGGSRAKALLKKFGSIHKIANASIEEFQEVEGIDKDAAKIHMILNAVYFGRD